MKPVSDLQRLTDVYKKSTVAVGEGGPLVSIICIILLESFHGVRTDKILRGKYSKWLILNSCSMNKLAMILTELNLIKVYRSAWQTL